MCASHHGSSIQVGTPGTRSSGLSPLPIPCSAPITANSLQPVRMGNHASASIKSLHRDNTQVEEGRRGD